MEVLWRKRAKVLPKLSHVEGVAAFGTSMSPVVSGLNLWTLRKPLGGYISDLVERLKFFQMLGGQRSTLGILWCFSCFRPLASLSIL